MTTYTDKTFMKNQNHELIYAENNLWQLML